MHHLHAGWSSDSTVDEADVLAGASDNSDTITLPDETGSQFRKCGVLIWRS